MPEPIDFTSLSERNLLHTQRLAVTVANGASFVALDMKPEEMRRATNVIYIHRHRESKKCYVGITVQSAGSRWYSGPTYELNRRFGPALKKHGWEAFDSYILAFGESRDDLNRAEVIAIAAAGGHKSKYTYNLSPGGDVVAENDKPIVGVNLATGEQSKFKSGSDAARQLGIPNVDAPMSIARGEGTSIKGWWFRFADDTDAKPPETWGESLRVEAVRAKRSKKVVGVWLDTCETRLFDSTAAAARSLGLLQSMVSVVANGKIRSTGGWWFHFEGDEREPPEIYGQKSGRLIRDKPVYAWNHTTKERQTYRNCTVADDQIGIHRGSAASVARGARASAKGWWFSYDENATPPEVFAASLVAVARSKAVIATEVATGKEILFESAKAAAESLSMSRASISCVISGKLHTVKGYKFRFDA